MPAIEAVSPSKATASVSGNVRRYDVDAEITVLRAIVPFTSCASPVLNW